MQKRLLFLPLVFVLALILSTSLVLADHDGTEHTDEVEEDLSDITEEEIEEELGDGGSINGFDRFLDRIFSSDEEYSRERAAEIRTLIREGQYEEAKELLKEYEDSIERFEKEVSPEEKDRAERRSKVIRKAYGDIINDIPPEFRDDFNKIRVAEKRVENAAEIASKIKDLCETLAKVDPDQYYRTCKADDDAPKWQRELHEDLTEEQQDEAEEFFKTMSQCFRDPANCQCGDITVQAFADKCTVIAPLAAACESGDESACEQMDEIEEEEPIEDLLPPHLQRVFQKLDDFEDDRFEHHMPRECEEAGATDRKSCEEIMIRTHAPQSCIEAWDSGEISFDNERQFREQCERIEFEANAPQECIDAGLTDHRDCGKLLFDLEAPQECKDAGLTGDSPRDHRKCDEIMRSLDHGFEDDRRGPGPGHGFDPGRCLSIESPEERLDCFDKAASHAQDRFHDFEEDREHFEDRFRETKEAQRQCAQTCSEQNKPWDFSNGECECRDAPEFHDDFDRREHFRPPIDHHDDFRGPPRDHRNEFHDDDFDKFDKFKEEFGREPHHDDFRDFEDRRHHEDDRHKDDFREDHQDQPPQEFHDEPPQESPPEDKKDSDSSDS